MTHHNPNGRRWVGRVLNGRWQIDARIARGGVGTVYAATHKNNGSRAAIKVLHAEFARDQDTRSRFLQEGYAANQVNHPGVVRILDDDTSEDGHVYLVMELLEGELLETRRVRKGGKLPLPDVYEIGDQLLDVLAAAHEKGIVHRDIKPDNLFITEEGRLKVLDFGFAQMRSQFRPDVTATGFLLGTPGFMSPEQSMGNRAEVNALTDIWAVGATLFTLISGEPVHTAQNAAAILLATANYPARSLATATTGVPAALVSLVDRAIAYDKAHRWADARAMQSALREVAGTQTTGTVSRRSIPDTESDASDPRLNEDPMFVEELDPSDLVDSHSASWPHARPAVSFRYPASETTQPAPNAPVTDPTLDTVIMHNPAATINPYGVLSRSPPNPSAPPLVDPATFSSAPEASLPQPTAAAFTPSPLQNFAVPSTRTDATPLVRVAPAPPSRHRHALVFVVIAVVTMILVVLIGLMILTWLDTV